MSAEIPGSKPEFRQATGKAIQLVTKVLVVTGERTDTSHVYGLKIGGYTGEILLTALSNAGLLSPDFTPQRLNDAVSAIDAQMDLDSRVAEVQATQESLRIRLDMP